MVYDHVWKEPKNPSSSTGEQLNGTVTFDQQEGMPTPWQHWEEAMHFLLDEFPLHQFKTKATLKRQTRGDLTIVEPHSPEEEGEDETEYLMTTNTKFSLSMNQQSENPDEPLLITGTGTIYAAACTKVPLGTVRVKIEMEQNAQSPQEEHMSIRGNRTPLSEDFILKAQEINQAPADHQPRMAMELLQEARKTLNSIHAVTTQPTTSGSRAVLAKFQDESFIIIRMVDQILQARNGQIPYQEAELIGPDGRPLSWRALMDNLSRHNTVARKTVEAHLGPGPHNPLDTGALELAAWEAERHAVNVMNRLPLEYRDCFQHLADIPRRAVYTALMQDGSRVAWIRSAGASGREPRWKEPLAVAAIPPDPRLPPEELRRHGDCSSCGSIAIQDANARRVRADAYGMDVDEVFCLVCLGEGREFLED